jgi:hypothetical protein
MNGIPAVLVVNVAYKTSTVPRPSSRSTIAVPDEKPDASASSSASAPSIA